MSLGSEKSPLGNNKPQTKKPDPETDTDTFVIPLWVYVIAGLAVIAGLYFFLRRKTKQFNKKELSQKELERNR